MPRAGARKILVAVVLAVVAAVPARAPASSTGDPVTGHLTSPGDEKHLERQPGAHFGNEEGAAQYTVDVDPSRELQRIRGFGAAFTDSSLWLLSRLSPDQRERTLRSLLDPRSGIGLSVMRVP